MGAPLNGYWSVLTSRNLVDWTERVLLTDQNQCSVSGIAASPLLGIVAVAHQCGSMETDGHSWLSRDGNTWEQLPTPSSLSAVANGPAEIVAMGKRDDNGIVAVWRLVLSLPNKDALYGPRPPIPHGTLLSPRRTRTGRPGAVPFGVRVTGRDHRASTGPAEAPTRSPHLARRDRSELLSRPTRRRRPERRAHMHTELARRVVVLAAVIALVAGCSTSSPSSSPGAGSPAPSQATLPATPTTDPSALPAATSAPTSTEKPVALDPFVGKVVVTVSDNLVVRSEPRVSDDSVMYKPWLPTGTELQVLDGPVSGSGFTWYEVEPVSFSGLDGPGHGWVAMAGKDGEPWIALSSATPAPASPTPSGGHIVGVVTGADGLPLGGISVEACGGPDCRHTTTERAATNGLNYDLGPLPAGAYRISFYDPSLTYAVAYYVRGGSSPSYFLGALIAVDETTAARADMRMPLANRIFGTVTGNGGVPLAGVDIMAWSDEAAVWSRGWPRDTTRADGSFAVRGLALGEYALWLSFPGMARRYYYSGTGDTTDGSAPTKVVIDGADVRIHAVLPVDGDSCGRPTERFRGWLMTLSPYVCANGSARRSTFGGAELTSVIGAGPGYVALGRREFTTGDSPLAAAFTSVDGRTWSAVEVDPRISGRLSAGSKWIVAVGPGTGGRSVDGIAWEPATLLPPSTATVVAVTTSGQRYVAIGQLSAGNPRAVAWTSTDGLRWKQVPDQAAFDHLCARAVTGGPSGFVAVGSDCHSLNASSAVVITSTDGLRWRRAPGQSAFAGNAAITSVIRGGPGYIAAGGHRPSGGRWRTAIWTSEDGKKWRQVLFVSGRIGWLVETDLGFEAVGEPRDRSWISTDGKSWGVLFPGLAPESMNGHTWSAVDAASNGSTVVIVGSYEWLDGASRTEYGGLVWQQTPS